MMLSDTPAKVFASILLCIACQALHRVCIHPDKKSESEGKQASNNNMRMPKRCFKCKEYLMLWLKLSSHLSFLFRCRYCSGHDAGICVWVLRRGCLPAVW